MEPSSRHTPGNSEEPRPTEGKGRDLRPSALSVPLTLVLRENSLLARRVGSYPQLDEISPIGVLVLFLELWITQCMTDMYRAKTIWSGGSPGNGVTTFYSTSIPTPATIKAFWTAIKANVPTGVTWTIKGSGDVIDDATGDLQTGWSAGGDLSETSSGLAGSYSGPSGAIVKFTSSTVVHNRRVQGRVYIVPLIGTVYDNNGTPSGGIQTVLQTAGSNLVSGFSGSMVVWSRPFAGTPAAGGRPANPSRPGKACVVTGATVPDIAVVLRSRR